MLFVPLTTVTMDPIPNEEMGNATSMFNLMRNIGGSTGIAASTTLLARREQLNFNLLGADVNPYNPQARELLGQLRAGFQSRGSDAFTARRRAYRAVFGIVGRQAAIISFIDVFRLLGWIFLLMVPFILIMKSPRTRRRGPAAME
jgi:DHA2 family multidrug resistance protein